MQHMTSILTFLLIARIVLDFFTINGTTYATQIIYAVLFFVAGAVTFQDPNPGPQDAFWGWSLIAIGVFWCVYAYLKKSKLLEKFKKSKEPPEDQKN